jgi:hypothetical protein
MSTNVLSLPISRVIEGGQRHKETRTFRCVTPDLLALRRWLAEEGCTHVALESTGVYWRPVYDRLVGACEVIVANAQHIKKGFCCKKSRQNTMRVSARFLINLGSHFKQAGEEHDLALDISLDHPVHLPLANHVHDLVALQRARH